MKAFFNHEFIDEKNASLHISDLSILRGYAVFDFFRTKEFVPLFLQAHVDRFFHSAEKLNLQIEYGKEAIFSIIEELISKNEIPDAGIRLLLTGGYSDDGFTPSVPNLIITQQPFEFRSAAKFAAGIKLVTHEHQRELPEAKTTGYITGVNLQSFIAQKKADDVLYYFGGHISECRRANFFIINNDGVLVTAGKGILKGITRSRVLDLAGRTLKVLAGELKKEEIYNAAEAFVTSTTKRVLPVVEIDGRKIGNGKPGRFTVMIDELLKKNEEEYYSQHNVLTYKITSNGPANNQPVR